MPPTDVNPTLHEDDVNPAIQEAADNANKEGSVLVDTNFYNAQDGLNGRPGGVYLDVQQRVEAELLRAQSEDREPDLEVPPASAGTTLVTEDRLVHNPYSNPSSQVPVVNEVGPISTLPVDIGTTPNPEKKSGSKSKSKSKSNETPETE